METSSLSTSRAARGTPASRGRWETWAIPIGPRFCSCPPEDNAMPAAMDRPAAESVIRSYLAQRSSPDHELVLLEAQTRERPSAWIFFYQTRRFVETGDYADALGGNAPLIVDRRDGSVHLTGTARPIEYY